MNKQDPLSQPFYAPSTDWDEWDFTRVFHKTDRRSVCQGNYYSNRTMLSYSGWGVCGSVLLSVSTQNISLDPVFLECSSQTLRLEGGGGGTGGDGLQATAWRLIPLGVFTSRLFLAYCINRVFSKPWVLGPGWKRQWLKTWICVIGCWKGYMYVNVFLDNLFDKAT